MTELVSHVRAKLDSLSSVLVAVSDGCCMHVVAIITMLE